MPVMTSVPATRGSTPNSGSAKRGDHCVPNRKSVIGTLLKNSIVGTNSDQMIPTVVRIDTAAAAMSSPPMTFSP